MVRINIRSLARAPLLLRLLLLVLVLAGRLALGFDDGGGDAVEVALAVLRDAPPAVRRELEHADLLERLRGRQRGRK